MILPASLLISRTKPKRIMMWRITIKKCYTESEITFSCIKNLLPHLRKETPIDDTKAIVSKFPFKGRRNVEYKSAD